MFYKIGYMSLIDIGVKDGRAHHVWLILEVS